MRRLALSIAACAAFAFTSPAAAAVDPAGCTDDLAYDSSIPTFQAVVGSELGGYQTGTTNRHVTQDLYDYMAAVVAATADNPRVKVIEKDLGTTTLGTRRLRYAIIGSKDNIDNLEAGRDDAAFWSGVISGATPASVALEQVHERPAFGWVTATPHGNEPAAGEASMRLLYELAARLDCQNAQRLRNLTLFIDPARNPDGRDGNARTTAWGFDPNRDFGTQTQIENRSFLPEITKYPGPFFIDAHQQSSGYFFPPNEDPVHHEISDFALDFIQDKIGPALQQRFNDQSSAYQNYNRYDLFTPEYGDTVPALLMGAAGMTYEKGTSESYGKQVYDHYLAMDTTVNVTSNDKVGLLSGWIAQWQEAIDQGARCELQRNKLVSPLHTEITQQPSGDVCGYFFKPDMHMGDVARLFGELRTEGVEIFQLDEPVTVDDGVHVFGPGGSVTDTLPAGTLWIPMAQPMKHWIQAVLGEDPFIPFNYFYDVVTWSYTLNRGLAGNGVLTRQLPSGVAMTRVNAPNFGMAPADPAPVYAFNTDSSQGLALLIELLDAGATGYRGATAFDADGHHFTTGAALISGPSVTAGMNLALKAAARQTPVYALQNYPVARYAIAKPKIGLFAGAAEPANPNPASTGGVVGHCTSTAYCEALFTLREKLELPDSVLSAVTDAQTLAMTANGYTALINPNQTMSAGSAGLQAFVNGGGRYVGTGANGTTAARTAGLTALNTQSLGGLTTPGSTFDSTVDTTSPAAWGFDAGAFIYRSVSSEPNYDPSTLAGTPPAIPAAKAAVSYANPLKSYGYHVGATGPGRLDGRPVVVDQPFGSGRAVLVGVNAFFRSWHETAERWVLNGALMPTGAVIAAPAAGRRAAATPAQTYEQQLEPESPPVAKSELPAVKPRPVRRMARTDRDVRIRVYRHDRAALRRAVRKARLPRKVRSRVRYVHTRRTTTLIVRGVRTSNQHARSDWVARLMKRLDRARVKPLHAQL